MYCIIIFYVFMLHRSPFLIAFSYVKISVGDPAPSKMTKILLLTFAVKFLNY